MKLKDAKICISCKWFDCNSTNGCRHPSNLVGSLIDGAVETKHNCKNMRYDMSSCGLEGKLWEPLPTRFMSDDWIECGTRVNNIGGFFSMSTSGVLSSSDLLVQPDPEGGFVVTSISKECTQASSWFGLVKAKWAYYGTMVDYCEEKDNG